jgi:hypothetical protein
MNSLTCSTTFDSSLDAMVDYCRSLVSRERCWPGALGNHESDSKLYYQLAMQLNAATITDLDVEEVLSPVEKTPDGVSFTSTWRLTWPDGVGNSVSVYAFHAGTPNTLEFTYSYDAPSTDLIKTKNLPKFHSAMEHIANRYLERLTDSVIARS